MTPGSRADVALVAPYGPKGASTRVRALEWFAHLGLSPELHTYIGAGDTVPATLLRAPARVAVAEGAIRWSSHRRRRMPLLLLRNASPFSNGRLEERLLSGSSHGVYDFDDALMIQQPGRVAATFSRARVWKRSVRAADVVVAGNDLLADAASRYAREVVVVPTCVDPSLYRVKTDHTLGDPPRAVWLGSPSTEPYLAQIAAALLAEHRRSGLRVTVISSGARPLGELDAVADRVEWGPGVAEATLADADVGLMPLADGPWERGKCAYKLLQYAAAGLPTVGSPVGVNRDVLALLDGLAPANVEEWSDALCALLAESPERRRQRGQIARTGVEDHFSYDRWAEVWRRAVAIP